MQVLTLHQCSIPVFDGLLPEPHNQIVLKLLFLLAFWHGLAKLRMHTDRSLTLMDNVTTHLGKQMRLFTSQTCAAFSTRELRKEVIARINRAKTSVTQKKTSAPSHLDASTSEKQTSQCKKTKSFNLNTYKLHSLGDYVATIKRIGTTDSYSTERVNTIFMPENITGKRLCSRANLSTAHQRRDMLAPIARRSSAKWRSSSAVNIDYVTSASD